MYCMQFYFFTDRETLDFAAAWYISLSFLLPLIFIFIVSLLYCLFKHTHTHTYTEKILHVNMIVTADAQVTPPANEQTFDALKK